ncbi:dephospho-CoA kinase [Bacillus altitudinis]|uniref:dephospho-CoA kinase n=1 Tax=Bacillus altitudinis TaxID=293387 RepID=UPI0025706171|nr:dephospho-CoA kinase [Bacillus altitudinis]MEE3605409.1 dephospho-CoA kinase [Bacillus altitudinis]MEE3611546.1 dephospho-CoA kinase [Bacillus altitudinis]MEE3647084.1 dephospho-CoA kinase [Bacillus altitudinis]MEE4391507.1 dephospho-CoA kinase [Bacillus altitudinis]MEE4395296.1 dephospho-CoA kinase [Bacillus altitudinis]
MTLVIGLTGGIASGKSTVSQMIKEKGIRVVDADVIAKEAVSKGSAALHQIVQTFGEEVLLPNGELNRQQLGAIIFSDEEKRKQLNAIVHPEVRKEMLEQRDEGVSNNETFVVLDIPLLFESKLEGLVDRIIVVYTTPELQLSRLMNRNDLSEEEALNRIHSQQSLEEKCQKADRVIENTKDLAFIRKQLENILNEWEHTDK